MNYLRGAVNAISAPYQYYKDINPSTLTGAIDVIVISRPKQNVHVHPDTANSHSSDETELVCSPFHVRFGKWQVLRPGDKKVRLQIPLLRVIHTQDAQVNVFVNGNPVPFPMKIGEAGEAFFVFETDDDIPDDIVTSPILEATQPGQSNAEPQHAGRFGAKEDPHGGQEGAASQEPDFLDLNAAPEEPEPPRSETQHSGLSLTKPTSEGSEEQESAGSSSLLARTAQVGKAVLQAASEAEQSGIDKFKGRTVTEAISEVTNDERIFLAEKASAARDATEQSTKNYLGFEDSRGDEVLPPGRDVQPPDVVYTEVQPSSCRYAKTLRLTSDQLKSLNLKSGANTITFSLSATGAIACTARLFVWDHADMIVVSDIDGTITKSDALGHVFTMIGRDWTHLGVAKLYTDICRNGYKMMYLTSRAIGQADSTRDYLKGIKQNDYQLPEGPVIMSPDRLMASLHREVIMRKPEVFKMACLRDIQKLFGTSSRNPFYAGFGNRITDALSYRSVNVPSSRIFTIDSSGEVKMELLELAGYKSSYIHMTDLVDQMFPPIHRKWAAEYTDFNFWKTPVQEFPLPDLTPPSPALSARSDTSNQRSEDEDEERDLGQKRLRRRSAASMPGSLPGSRGSLSEDEMHFEMDEDREALAHAVFMLSGTT
ncbi:Lipin/Ned1/Smp2-domain-containing protein [Amylocystis lapponica]|nr:Lipin/Ned1/Smp2-domain-containing protein [Amylocystis lapponica]